MGRPYRGDRFFVFLGGVRSRKFNGAFSFAYKRHKRRTSPLSTLADYSLKGEIITRSKYLLKNNQQKENAVKELSPSAEGDEGRGALPHTPQAFKKA